MAIYESFLQFYIYLKTENRECIRPNIHKTRVLHKVGNMTLLPNLGKPGFYGVGLPERVIWCQPRCILIRVDDSEYMCPGQMLHQMTAYFDLHCILFPKRDTIWFSKTRVNKE